MATTTDLSVLRINYLTQAQYSTAVSNNTINPNELYLTPSATLTVGEGGTGNTSFTASRAIFSETASKLSSSSHFMNSTKLAINSTSEPSYNLLVQGDSRLNGCLHIFPTSGGYKEGVRIHAYSNWSDITLCGADNTGDSGISANSWFIGNNNSNFYIVRNGSTASGTDATRAEFSCVSNVWKLRSYIAAGVSGAYRSGLHIYGPTYGNDAALLISGTAGLFSWNDGGPQITFDTSATPGGAQAGALIYTDHDNAATGVSWHFVSNQTDWNVTSKRFHARTSISIGTDKPVTSDALYINGTTLTTNNISRTAASLGGTWLQSRDKAVINVDASDSTSSTAFSLARIKFSTKTYAICSERAGNAFGIYGWLNSRTENGTDWAFYIGNDTYFHCNTRLYGAVWNDYAEYRQTKEEIKPGRVVVEIGNGDMKLSDRRLQPGANVVTDTFGFAIGKTEIHKTPIAVSGRVLAYPYESIDEFKKHIGGPVCSGPDGTVSIMTINEERLYPSRIIGTISEIPEYEEWGTENIKVDGRIWIRIR